jgi:predicted RNA-binding Zn-ribbon protein involved in translation (DUF1610 family)
MVTAQQQTAYRCSQCGSPEIVALSLLYEQGTRSFSGRFTFGVSQSIAAKAAAPPAPKHYFHPFVLWGPVIIILSFWIYAGFRSVLLHPGTTALKGEMIIVLLLLSLIVLAGLLFSLRKIARYNREVYPRLYSDWAQTFMCRRCGKYSLIRS